MLDERYEIVEFSPHIPIKIFMHKLGNVTKHWHKSLELLLVLDGEIEITMNGEVSILKNEDIILINSNTIHDIKGKDAVMIALQLKLDMFSDLNPDFENLVFDCNSSKDNDMERYKGIQFVIARMIRDNTHRSEGADYKNYSLCYFLISELLDYFLVPNPKEAKSKQKYALRLIRIINYINDHYKENFGLSDLAESENLSVPYLSNFFDKHMGINFSQYYTNVKLEHAVNDLLKSDDSIETIALNNGFTEYHAFIRAFKKKYDVLPNAYRKEKKKKNSLIPDTGNLSYLMIEPSKYLHLLNKYLASDDKSLHDTPKIVSTIYKEDIISSKTTTRKLKHNFKKFTSVGRAKELLDHDVQKMLTDLQKNIGYEYIKFHGILSDDMLVCTRKDDKLQFRYTLIDKALDFLISINLKPLIQLSFMPLALASNPNKNVFQSPYNTSPPKNINEWTDLIEDFTRHLISRYGRNEVELWPFCVWNEPATSNKMFGFDNNLIFFEFYKSTYEIVKKVSPQIQFGSPSILSMEDTHSQSWESLFIRWTISNNCKPDFINIHYYSDIIPKNTFEFILSDAKTSKFPKHTDDFTRYINKALKNFYTLGVGHMPVYLTEWNFTLSHRNLVSDTCYKSCYILKNLMENYDSLDSFGYWCLTDLIEENPLAENLFHGGLGIYTMNGLRKSVFYSFYFANMLGDDLIGSGEGYFITKKDHSYQIISYNYVHYGDLFASGELFDMTDTNRYSAFNMTKKMTLSLDLKDLENGRYEIKEYFVNRENGSAYDIWVNMGGLPLTSKDTELFRGLCVPGFHIEQKYVYDFSLLYNATLEPLEIRIAEITLME